VLDERQTLLVFWKEEHGRRAPGRGKLARLKRVNLVYFGDFQDSWPLGDFRLAEALCRFNTEQHMMTLSSDTIRTMVGNRRHILAATNQ
jgi:hypothetical protein